MESVECANGKYGNWKPDCPESCEYFDSCKYYSGETNPDSARKVRNAVKFEKVEKRIAKARAPKQQSVAPDISQFSGLAEMFQYIISLDDNTCAAICEIIANPYSTQSEIARRRGVSRQRINTSLLYACKAHPELVPLFRLCVKKVTINRNRYKKQTTSEKADDNQLPLVFE